MRHLLPTGEWLSLFSQAVRSIASCPGSFMAVGWRLRVPMSIYGGIRGEKGGVNGTSASGEAPMLVCGTAH